MTDPSGPVVNEFVRRSGDPFPQKSPILLRGVGALLVVLFGAFLAITTGIANVSYALGAAPSLPFSSIVGPARIADLSYRFLAAKGVVAPSLAARARAAASDDPLADEPFLYAAAAYFPNQSALGAPPADALLRESLRRNPRSLLALSLALRRAIGAGNIDAAMDHLAVFNRLNQSLGAPMLEGVGRSVNTSYLVDSSARALAAHPELIPAFIRGFVAEPKDVGLIERMATKLPKSAVSDPVVGQALIRRLVEGGQFDAALRVWQSLGGQRGSGLVNDPTFARKSGLKPFDWERFENDSGAADAAEGGGLAVEYYGRTVGPLLQQLIRLTSGSYLVNLDVEGVAGNAGAIALQLSCARVDRVLAALPLNLRPGRQRLKFPVIISPNECDGQYIALVGLPRENHDDQALIVRRLDIERLR